MVEKFPDQPGELLDINLNDGVVVDEVGVVEVENSLLNCLNLVSNPARNDRFESDLQIPNFAFYLNVELIQVFFQLLDFEIGFRFLTRNYFQLFGAGGLDGSVGRFEVGGDLEASLNVRPESNRGRG